MDREAFEKDTEFYTYVIDEVRSETVEPGEPEAWVLRAKGGGSIHIRNIERVPEPPKIGEEARFYGKGLGYSVRGVVVGERVYSYMTDADQEAAQKKHTEERKAERMLQFAEKLPQFEADVAALPQPFQARFAWFRSTSPSWQHEFGPYELFACQEAVKIAHGLKIKSIDTDETVAAIRNYSAMSVEAQKRLVPGVAYHEHSGNTFNMACTLAAFYVSNPELLSKYHGALCALVGCTAYGCWAVSDEANAERAKRAAETPNG